MMCFSLGYLVLLNFSMRIDALLTRQARDERTVMSQISKSTMMDGVSHCVT